MIRLEFSAEDLETLRHERLYHPHPRVRQRLEAVYLKSRHVPHREICASVKITKPTLVKYLRLYQRGGLSALKGVRFRQPSSALAPYEGLIREYFTQQPPATLAEASHGVERLTGVTRSPAQVGKLLKRWGLKRRKVGALPGPPPSDARFAEQEQFRDQELMPRLAEAQAGQRVVFFQTQRTLSMDCSSAGSGA
jgi:transposase